MRKNLGMLALIMAFWFTISFITAEFNLQMQQNSD